MNARPYLLALVVALIIGAIYFLGGTGARRNGASGAKTITPRADSGSNPAKSEEKPAKYELAKEITGPHGFINTGGKPITIGELIGKKVILVDFWTYSCINCRRTTPYLNAWYEKYGDRGLEIIGVHTPEFGFEKEYANVKSAVEKFMIEYPVVLDNDYSTWTAYENRYWPRKYLIDIDGYIVYDHIGEGAYEETERRIQEALRERMVVLEESGTIDMPVTKEVTPEGGVRSPEIYFGAARNAYLGNGTPNVAGPQNFSEPAVPRTNTLYLAGDWDLHDEFAENTSGRAKIIFRYRARDVYFVAGSEDGVKIKILNDGKLVGEQTVGEHTLYNAVRNPEYGEHTLEIIVEKPGLRAFTFTFG